MTTTEQKTCEAIIRMAHKDEPDYWTRLKHQAAISAMQVYLVKHRVNYDVIADWSIDLADMLVKKLKEI